MNKNFKQLTEEAKTLKLSPSEKADIKNQLVLFVKSTAGVSVASAGLARSSKRPWFANPIPAFIAIALLLITGTSFAAEQALPGDMLYPIKTDVNEEVRSWIAFSPKAKAQLNVDLATKRLEEAEKLGAKTELNAQARTQIESNFKAHSDRIETLIEKLKATDSQAAAELSSELETSLKTHSKILLNIGDAKDGTTKIQIDGLLNKIKTEEKNSKDNRIQTEDNVSAGTGVQIAAKARLQSAQNKIDEVRRFIEKNQDQLDATTRVQIEARLKTADNLIARGKVKFDAKMYGEAFMLFQRAHATAQEVRLLLRAKADFENDDDNERYGKDDIETSPLIKPSPVLRTNGKARPFQTENGPTRTDGKIRIEF